MIYNTWKAKDGNDWANGAAVYRVLIADSDYVPDPDHSTPANATGLLSNELTGGSYARQTLLNRAKALNTSTDKYEHTADNVTFTGLVTATPAWAIVFRVVNDDTDHQLVCAVPITGLAVFNGDMILRWNGGATNGIVFTGS